MIANLRVPDIHLEALECVAAGTILCLSTTMPIAEGRMQRAVCKTPLTGLLVHGKSNALQKRRTPQQTGSRAAAFVDLQVTDVNESQRGKGIDQMGQNTPCHVERCHNS